MKPDRNPFTPHSFKCRLMCGALRLNSFLDRKSLPLWKRSWTATSKPSWITLLRNSGVVVYSPCGMKLNDERKPSFFSTSINSRHFFKPTAPSTSWVRTKANCLPLGQPFQPAGGTSDPGVMGQTPPTSARFLSANQRRIGTRTETGTSGFML